MLIFLAQSKIEFVIFILPFTSCKISKFLSVNMVIYSRKKCSNYFLAFFEK